MCQEKGIARNEQSEEEFREHIPADRRKQDDFQVEPGQRGQNMNIEAWTPLTLSVSTECDLQRKKSGEER